MSFTALLSADAALIQARYASPPVGGVKAAQLRRFDEASIDSMDSLIESIQTWPISGKATDTNIR